MRQLILFLASAGLITAFFLLPANRTWFNERIITYYQEFNKQQQTMDVKQRLANRFGNYYTASRKIAGAIQSRAGAEALVLMPPTAYFIHHGIDYRVPEPVVFYYFTRLRTVWPNSPHAKKANWYVHVVNRKLIVDSVRNRKNFLDTLKAFNKYDITL